MIYKRISRYSLYPSELVPFLYLLITSVLDLILILCSKSTITHFCLNSSFILILFLLCLVNTYKESLWIKRVRYIFPILLCGWLYIDTFHYNRCFENVDFLFAHYEQNILSFQTFSLCTELLPQLYINEAMYFGYMLFPVVVLIFVSMMLFKYPNECNKAMFILIFSLLLYFLFFLFIPVVGPRLYFQIIGFDQARIGNFLPIGTFFYPLVNYEGVKEVSGVCSKFFYSLCYIFERPTGAFPSCCIGIISIIFLYFIKYHKYHLLWYAPLYCFILISTLCIKFHYTIDIVGGLLTSYFFYSISLQMYEKMQAKKEF